MVLKKIEFPRLGFTWSASQVLKRNIKACRKSFSLDKSWLSNSIVLLQSPKLYIWMSETECWHPYCKNPIPISGLAAPESSVSLPDEREEHTVRDAKEETPLTCFRVNISLHLALCNLVQVRTRLDCSISFAASLFWLVRETRPKYFSLDEPGGVTHEVVDCFCPPGCKARQVIVCSERSHGVACPYRENWFLAARMLMAVWSLNLANIDSLFQFMINDS